MQVVAPCWLAFGAFFLLSHPVGAAEPAQEPEKLSAPRKAVAEAPPLPAEVGVLPPPPPVSRYEVWQARGVDARGYFRTRVIYSPHVPYYYYNGKPYWYTTVYPRAVMPY